MNPRTLTVVGYTCLMSGATLRRAGEPALATLMLRVAAYAFLVAIMETQS